MSEPFIVPKKEGKLHLEPLRRKVCAFPGCKVVEKMTGKGIYCKEHRKRQYRKTIDADKVSNQRFAQEVRNLNQNQLIQHDYSESITMIIPCQLEGCRKEFEIQIYPKTFVYPKFCLEHRNPWKRERFLNQSKELKNV